MTRPARPPRLALAAIAALLAFFVSSSAQARSVSLPEANVVVAVERDGSLAVDERISVVFDGTFTFGYRDIPLRTGESIDDISVGEGGEPYSPGGSAAKSPGLTPGTFGVSRSAHRVSIVWHFQITNDVRTFTIHYRLRGVAVAYADVVDVDLQVWGSEWQTGLGSLLATLRGPAAVERAWGHPVYVRGDVTLAGPTVTLRALGVPSHQFVELRALVPRSAFASTAGMRVASGDGLGKIEAEEQADARAYTRDHDRIENAKRHPWWPLLELLAIGILPASAVLAAVWWFYGRERRSGYDREYEQQPPTDTQPALVTRLLAEGGTAGSFEFTATLFDLIRRKVYKATPTTTERSTWGGLHKEQLSDLEIGAGESHGDQLEPWERSVAEVVDHIIGNGTARLSEFRETIEAHRESMSKRFTSFKEQVSSEVARRRWFVSAGALPLALALVVFVTAGAVLLFLALHAWRPVYPRWRDVVLVALGVCALVNAALMVVGLTQRRLWRRRTAEAETEAERWEAFRRYLTDFPRLQDAPPATLALWERFLVYGISFGIADRVLQAAHLAMPKEMHDASSIYWIAPNVGLGSGPSAIAINDLAAGFGSALAPPSSGSGGFGGGFSGGGGGGGGGGGFG